MNTSRVSWLTCLINSVTNRNKLLSTLMWLQPMTVSWVATKLFGTSHRIGWENDIQTKVTVDPSPKTVELRANKIQWLEIRGSTGPRDNRSRLLPCNFQSVNIYEHLTGLNANEIQISYDKHHRVSSLVKSHQNTHNRPFAAGVTWPNFP